MTTEHTSLSDAQRALLARRLRGRPSSGRTVRRAVPVGRRIPSTGQRGMWFLEQLAAGSPAHNVPFTVTWPGQVGVDLLERCVTEIVRRHEVLRTRFTAVSGELTVTVDQPAPVRIPVTELAADTEVPTAVAAECGQTFDLATTPLLRVRVLRVPGRADTVVGAFHHVVADAWSLGVFARELSTLYSAFAAGEPSPLTEPAVHYGDFAAWHNRQLADGAFEPALRYWADLLADAPPATALAARAGSGPTRHRGRTIRLHIDAATLRRSRELASAHDATLFMVLVAVLNALLDQYTSATDILLGMATAGRDLPETADMMGYFTNTVVLRTSTDGDPTAAEVLDRTRATCLAAYAHQQAPFELVAEHLRHRRGTGNAPLFEVMVANQDSTFDLPEAAGIRLRGVDLGVSAFPLSVLIDASAADLLLLFEYDTDRYDHDTVTDLVDHFDQLLRAFVADPARRVAGIPLFPPVREQAGPAPATPSPAPPPAPATAENIARVLAAVLGRATVSATDNFFDLGGNSMLLIEVRSRLHRELALTPTLVDLYTYPTANALAAHLTAPHPTTTVPNRDSARLRAAAALRRTRRDGEHR